MDPAFHAFVGRLADLPDQYAVLREGVQKAVLVADVDPEMALTRVRKVLEYVIREIYQKRTGESPGTRPLENLLQRLAKDGHVPSRLDAYANTIRKLGNVGTHAFGETITTTDVQQSLGQLMLILEWYFDTEQPNALSPFAHKFVQTGVPNPGQPFPPKSLEGHGTPPALGRTDAPVDESIDVELVSDADGLVEMPTSVQGRSLLRGNRKTMLLIAAILSTLSFVSLVLYWTIRRAGRFEQQSRPTSRLSKDMVVDAGSTQTTTARDVDLATMEARAREVLMAAGIADGSSYLDEVTVTVGINARGERQYSIHVTFHGKLERQPPVTYNGSGSLTVMTDGRILDDSLTVIQHKVQTSALTEGEKREISENVRTAIARAVESMPSQPNR
jgi:hypothetical protein